MDPVNNLVIYRVLILAALIYGIESTITPFKFPLKEDIDSTTESASVSSEILIVLFFIPSLLALTLICPTDSSPLT